MARYIDADALYKKLYPFDSVDKGVYTINAKAVADAIAKTPTADVVPKSKCELAVAEREANVKGFTEELVKVRTEVAREIFEEIETSLCYKFINRELHLVIRESDYREYKNKYCIESEVTK